MWQVPPVLIRTAGAGGAVASSAPPPSTSSAVAPVSSSPRSGPPSTPRLCSVGSRGSPLVPPGGVSHPCSDARARSPSASEVSSSMTRLSPPSKEKGIDSLQISRPSPAPQAQPPPLPAPSDVTASTGDELRELVLQERRERVDEQRALRIELRSQKEMLGQVAGNLDKALRELQGEVLPRMQENLSRVAEMQDVHTKRTASLERGLAEESEARIDAEQAQARDLQELRQQMSSELQRAHESFLEVHESLQQHRFQERSDDGPCTVGITAHHAVAEAEDENDEFPKVDEVFKRNFEDRFMETVAKCTGQVSDLEKRISEEWTSLRGLVDAAVVAMMSRVSSLESTLQTDVDERLKRLQADMDKLSTDARNGNDAGASNRGMQRACGQDRVSMGRSRPAWAAEETGNGGSGVLNDTSRLASAAVATTASGGSAQLMAGGGSRQQSAPPSVLMQHGFASTLGPTAQLHSGTFAAPSQVQSHSGFGMPPASGAISQTSTPRLSTGKMLSVRR